MRIHAGAASVVFLFAAVARPPLPVAVAGVAAVAVVMAAELANSALEAVVDLAANGAYSGTARHAKDAAAGAVLVVAMGAVAVGVWIVLAAEPLRWRLTSRYHLDTFWLSLGALVLLWLVTASSFVPARKPTLCSRSDSTRRRTP